MTIGRLARTRTVAVRLNDNEYKDLSQFARLMGSRTNSHLLRLFVKGMTSEYYAMDLMNKYMAALQKVGNKTPTIISINQEPPARVKKPM